MPGAFQGLGWKLQTPVCFLIFNRPDHTERVFAEIANAKPPKLLVVADGPRPDKLGEAEKCQDARAIIERVDWDCEVLKNYSDTNLGCRYRISSGLDWVFEMVGEAIILEDDALPHPTFFRFCEELLERYRDDERIFMISGRNSLGQWKPNKYSYYFSTGGVWGWATWKRAWQYNDVELKLYKNADAQVKMRSFFQNNQFLIEALQTGCEATLQGKVSSWAYPWGFARAVNQGMSINSAVNLIANIGFGEDSTHTKGTSIYEGTPVYPMKFPLKHNNDIAVDFKYVKKISKWLKEPIIKKILHKVHQKLSYLNKIVINR